MILLKKYIKKLYNFSWKFEDIILFIFIFIIKSYIFQKNISPTYFNFKSILNPILCSLLIIISIGLLLTRRLRWIYLYIVNIFISILYIIDLIYYKSSGDLLSFVSINNGYLKDIILTSPLNNFLNIQNLLFIADFIILFPLIRKNATKHSKNIHYMTRIIISLMLFLVSIVTNNSFINTLDKEQPGLLKNMSNKTYVSRVIGDLNYHAIDAYNYFIRNKKDIISINYSDKEIKDFLYSNFNKKAANNYTGQGKGKNLIVIQIESLQNFLIDKKVNGEEITPNLNKFIKRSLYYNNCFYQVMDGNTSDSEFMLNNSLYPLSSGAVYYKYASNYFNSLPKLLNDKGYTTAAFHGNNEGFWNRAVMYKSLGFQNFFGAHSLNIDEEIGLGLSDKSFFNQSLEKISSLQEPFYSFLITLSSHYPFTNTDNTFNKGELKNTFLGDYFSSIHYTDAQLGMFLEKLEAEGLLDKSILVIYGDHNGVPYGYMEDLYKLDKVNNPNELDYFMYQKVPLLIHFPKDEYSGLNNKYVGQMDIYPTIANLFNLNNPYMFGNDILDSSQNKVLFSSGSFIDKNIVYFSSSNCYYDISSGKKMPPSEYLKNLTNQYKKELNYSETILKNDLIKTFAKNNP
ncbi:Lipoteichoic acid synthase 2 [Clostridium liquoris]|mgnify:CR=1 FL=1|uniref:Lipoteichoic acid synthase 2 n=1 Tax=Clostridium liquoris TaxID=1289519 RepID=A0A2T0B2K4_9CLOT|nr:LTA synthase family protein [Clostridium liquoris]PRR78128.1 Lipoteichoic acid synthase 2 [Clostridium liquoris]